MDESRKQFEESWLRRGGESSDLIRYPENHHEIGSGDIGGQYVMDDIQGHWQTWQASRAAIEITAPKFIDSREALAKGLLLIIPMASVMQWMLMRKTSALLESK